MIGSLLILGFTLSLDNFRTAVALGGLAAQLAPLGGGRAGVRVVRWPGTIAGHPAGALRGETIGETGEYVGAIGLGLYGLYLLIRAWRTEAPEEMDRPWAVFGLIVPLSADNIVAGTSLGLLGVSLWLAPLVFGVTTALMALVGLHLGEQPPASFASAPIS